MGPGGSQQKQMAHSDGVMYNKEFNKGPLIKLRAGDREAVRDNTVPRAGEWGT